MGLGHACCREVKSDRQLACRGRYCDGVEARTRPGRRSAAAETEMTGDVESHELTEWQVVDWVY